MASMMIIFKFVGAWLHFTFPLYQAILETQDERAIKIFRTDFAQRPKISPFWWVIPPLKIYLERKRALQVLQKHHLPVQNLIVCMP